MRNIRYRNLSGFYRRQFGGRVHKIGLRGGFTCPNRDGAISTDGCSFCNPEAALPRRTDALSITDQLRRGARRVRERFGAGMFVAYFQDYTATWCDVGRLRKLCLEAIDFPDVVGLSLGTRPDCLPDDILALLEELSERTFLEVELGVQTASDATLAGLNRGHDSAATREAFASLGSHGIRCSAHVILGLPGERAAEMEATAALLRECRSAGVKLHNLHVLRRTALEDLYRNGRFEPPTLEQYANMAVRFLELTPPDAVVGRLVGDAPGRHLVAPQWPLHKQRAIRRIQLLLRQRDTWQGRKLGSPRSALDSPAVFARGPASP